MARSLQKTKKGSSKSNGDSAFLKLRRFMDRNEMVFANFSAGYDVSELVTSSVAPLQNISSGMSEDVGEAFATVLDGQMVTITEALHADAQDRDTSNQFFESGITQTCGSRRGQYPQPISMDSTSLHCWRTPSSNFLPDPFSSRTKKVVLQLTDLYQPVKKRGTLFWRSVPCIFMIVLQLQMVKKLILIVFRHASDTIFHLYVKNVVLSMMHRKAQLIFGIPKPQMSLRMVLAWFVNAQTLVLVIYVRL